MPAARGILLYSGGLDSVIAAKVLFAQNIELTGFQCILPFYPPDFDPETLPSADLARRIGLEVTYHRLGRDYIDLARNPPHGYGKRMNPCVDCKIHFIRKAAELMRETGADFVATGEVVGQRPMSQMKHMLNHIVKESGIEGRLLRPLSAQILKPTIPEEAGLVDRARLLKISGRGRGIQMALAREYGITQYESPSGGCLFTDVGISRRVRDLFDHNADIDALDMFFLTIGRHFRLTGEVKAIVSRNEKENNEFGKYIDRIDYLLEPQFRGPLIALKGDSDPTAIDRARALMARYSKLTGADYRIRLLRRGQIVSELDLPDPVSDIELEAMRI